MTPPTFYGFFIQLNENLTFRAVVTALSRKKHSAWHFSFALSQPAYNYWTRSVFP